MTEVLRDAKDIDSLTQKRARADKDAASARPTIDDDDRR